MADRDIIEHLTDEHRKLDQMWSQLQALHTQGSDEQAALARQIVKELSSHDAIELQLLYPALKRAGGEDLAEHAKDDHKKIRHLLAEVDGKDPSDPAIYGKLDEAIRLVKAHVAEEEGQMFPKLRTAMDRQELLDLGKLSETAEAVAPTHPHTTTPDGAIGATVVGAAAGMVDKVRDAIKGEK